MALMNYFPGVVTLSKNGGESLNVEQQLSLCGYLRHMERWTRRRGHFSMSNFFRELEYQLGRKCYVGARLLAQKFAVHAATLDEPHPSLRANGRLVGSVSRAYTDVE